jgi:hypothetical protein
VLGSTGLVGPILSGTGRLRPVADLAPSYSAWSPVAVGGAAGGGPFLVHRDVGVVDDALHGIADATGMSTSVAFQAGLAREGVRP